jgi:septum formation protein
MPKPHFIYLASASPRRQELLTQLGVPFELLLADSEENVESLEAVQRGETPTAYVQRVTQAKLQAALARRQARGLPDAPVLCADTTVALGRTTYGKPLDEADAMRMLSSLSAQTHRVLTAVAISASPSGKVHAALCVSRVSFARLTPRQIAAYIATREPFGKAGAYAIQGRAASFVSHISGSYSGIMGLPLFETTQLLRAAGHEVVYA